MDLGLILQLFRPVLLAEAALLYALGVGIAHYLGATISPGLWLAGQAWVTLLQISVNLFGEVYTDRVDRDKPHTPNDGRGNRPDRIALVRRSLRLAAMGCLAALAMLTVAMMLQAAFTPLTNFLMALAFLGGFFYYIPPVRLAFTGYGELIASLLMGFFIPAFAFELQTRELHRLLVMVISPLVFLHLAMMIVYGFESYAGDIQKSRQTLVLRMGWQNALVAHNLLVLGAYLLVGIALVFGLPNSVALPMFLSMPFGGLQIWLLRKLAAGQKPNWRLINLSAVATFIAASYLLTYSFWMN